MWERTSADGGSWTRVVGTAVRFVTETDVRGRCWFMNESTPTAWRCVQDEQITLWRVERVARNGNCVRQHEHVGGVVCVRRRPVKSPDVTLVFTAEDSSAVIRRLS